MWRCPSLTVSERNSDRRRVFPTPGSPFRKTACPLPLRALTLPGTTVADTARDLGVSLRSLQRLFHGLDLPPPEYWRLLSRARRAAAELAGPMPLAAIAADCGFSDQAHLTRETLRWFGQTPRQMQRDGATLSLLAQPALGNWSGGNWSAET